MRKLLVLTMLFALAACGGSRKEEITNPYALRMKDLSETGVIAMRRERWRSAESAFSRALIAAQLADSPSLVTRAWYNLGMARASAGNIADAKKALIRAQELARRYGDNPTYLRARLNLALLQEQNGEKGWRPDVLESRAPPDIHLIAGRLAHRQGRLDVAHKEYDLALRRSGKTRGGLLYKAQAYMGLAMTAKSEGDVKLAAKNADKALGLLRQVGAPKLTAHALLFSSGLDAPDSKRLDLLERAYAIYRALNDVKGQRTCLAELIKVESGLGHKQEAGTYRKRLQKLEQESKPDLQ